MTSFLALKLPYFDAIIANSNFIFSQQCQSCDSKIVSYLAAISYLISVGFASKNGRISGITVWVINLLNCTTIYSVVLTAQSSITLPS